MTPAEMTKDLEIFSTMHLDHMLRGSKDAKGRDIIYTSTGTKDPPVTYVAYSDYLKLLQKLTNGNS